MKNMRILVVEDEPIIAQDIADFLSDHGYIVQDICYDVPSAEASLRQQVPDLCILDINLEGRDDGVDLAHLINENYRLPFIFLTSYTDEFTLERAKETRPYGYISKPVNFDSLKSTIEVARYNFENNSDPRPFAIETINQHVIGELTPREFEILKDIYEGKTNQQLAEAHFISLSTVKTHVHRIYEKFDCHTRSELIAEIRRILTS